MAQYPLVTTDGYFSVRFIGEWSCAHTFDWIPCFVVCLSQTHYTRKREILRPPFSFLFVPVPHRHGNFYHEERYQTADPIVLLPEGISPETLEKMLASPEIAALLGALAKNM